MKCSIESVMTERGGYTVSNAREPHNHNKMRMYSKCDHDAHNDPLANNNDRGPQARYGINNRCVQREESRSARRTLHIARVPFLETAMESLGKLEVLVAQITQEYKLEGETQGAGICQHCHTVGHDKPNM